MKNQSHTRTRTRARLSAIPLIGALLLAGCSAPADEAASASPASGFTFAFPQANDSENFYQAFAQQYQEETGVEVELLPIPGDAYEMQLNTQLQAGNAADLFVTVPGQGQIHSIVKLAEAGLVAPLPAVSSDLIPDGSEALYTYEGKVFGQPTALSANSLIWSSTAATTAGVEPPKTFEQLLEGCSVARAAGVDYTVLAGSVGANLGFLAQTISATRVYATEPDWNQKRAAGEVTFASSAGWRQVLTDFVAMRDAGCFQKGAEGGGFDAISGGLVGGTALTVSIPGSATVGLGAAAEGKTTLSVQAFPAADGGKASIIASPLYVWAANAKADASVQAAVMAFIEWAAEPAQVGKFAELSGSVPASYAKGTALLPQYEPIADLLAEGAFSPEPNIQWPNARVYDALGSGMQGLLTGQTDIDGVLKAMDEAWG